MVHLLSLFVVLRNLKTKQNPGVAPPRQRLTLLLAQKSRKYQRCAGHVWRVKAATSIQAGLSDQEPALPPQDPRLLRTSPTVEDCSRSLF